LADREVKKRVTGGKGKGTKQILPLVGQLADSEWEIEKAIVGGCEGGGDFIKSRSVNYKWGKRWFC